MYLNFFHSFLSQVWICGSTKTGFGRPAYGFKQYYVISFINYDPKAEHVVWKWTKNLEDNVLKSRGPSCRSFMLRKGLESAVLRVLLSWTCQLG